MNKLESLSRILLKCVREDDDLKPWDIDNLALVINQKIFITKKKFNKVEEILKI